MPLLNLDEALDRLGGDEELLREIAGLFMEDYPKTLADIRRALDIQSGPALESAAHNLKGAVGNFGAAPVWEAARSLEQMGRENQLAHSEAAWVELNTTLTQLKGELEELVRGS
jgi:HPt (histidine-containing phosphotransfer) domain-containing protein